MVNSQIEAQRASVSLATRKLAAPEAGRALVATRGDTDYHVATQWPDVATALGVVYEAYRQTGLIEPQRSRMRLTKYHLLATSEVLVAKTHGQIVCTATLVRDNEWCGLPMETIFGDEIAVRRQVSARLAEVTCLACKTDSKPPLSVVTRLMALAIQSAKARCVDELLAVVHPDHADFYIGFLGFESFGGVKLYPSVRHHPAAALSLNLNDIKERHFKGYKRAFVPPFPPSTLRYRDRDEEVYERLQMLMDEDAEEA